MPKIHGVTLDKNLNIHTPAKVHIVDAGGRAVLPVDTIHKVGPGLEGFYSSGEFSMEAPAGFTTFIVEKGTEFTPCEITHHVARGSAHSFMFPIERWIDLAQLGWYSGNTHVHYNDRENRPDERLRLDPQVHDLYFTAISRLERWDLVYASNKYPPGGLPAYSRDGHVVWCGQENRHNRGDWEIGYGHILLLGITQPVVPLSRGLLAAENAPDYPPLCQDLDRARAQGSVNLWCHNGDGMETPVAAILGKVDAINLFDPFLYTPDDYQTWYDLLNCGIRLPCSTGSDWFICSNNRVYVHLEGQFSGEAWLAGLKAGQSFITNGPALFLTVNGRSPGESLPVSAGQELEIQVRWMWHQAIEALEIICNGEAIHHEAILPGEREGEYRLRIPSEFRRLDCSAAPSVRSAIHSTSRSSPIPALSGWRREECLRRAPNPSGQSSGG